MKFNFVFFKEIMFFNISIFLIYQFFLIYQLMQLNIFYKKTLYKNY